MCPSCSGAYRNRPCKGAPGGQFTGWRHDECGSLQTNGLQYKFVYGLPDDPAAMVEVERTVRVMSAIKRLRQPPGRGRGAATRVLWFHIR
jgi:hypothetical protein